MKIAVAELVRHKRRLAKELAQEKRRLIWLEANKDHLAAEAAATEARLQAERVAAEALLTKWAKVVKVLAASSSPFCQSILRDLNCGRAPRGRVLDICCEIYAQQFGRTNSKAYNQALNEIADELGA